MILLDDVGAWSAFAGWFQAITGLGLLVLAVFSYFQNKKITELADITNALTTQTEKLKTIAKINQKRLDNESDKDFQSSIPIFIIMTCNNGQDDPVSYPDGSICHKFELINLGTTAYNVTLIKMETELFFLSYSKIKHIFKDGVLKFDLVLNTDITFQAIKTCKFEIVSYNSKGQVINQVFTFECESVNHHLSKPDILS